MRMSTGRLKHMSLMTASVLLFTVLCLGVAIGLAVWVEHTSPVDIAQTLERVQPWLLLWRLVLFAVVIGGWPTWARLITRWQSWSEAQYERLVAARWTVALWLTVLELALGQNILGRFINLVTQDVSS